MTEVYVFTFCLIRWNTFQTGDWREQRPECGTGTYVFGRDIAGGTQRIGK
jgi:hypothetical protein